MNKKLIEAKKKAQEDYLTKILERGRNGWGEFYKYVRRRKSDSNVAPPIKWVGNTQELDESIIANRFADYFVTVFGEKVVLPTFDNYKATPVFEIRARNVRKNMRHLKPQKSVGPGGISGEVLMLGVEAIITYLIRLFEMPIKNSEVPDDWRNAIVVP